MGRWGFRILSKAIKIFIKKKKIVCEENESRKLFKATIKANKKINFFFTLKTFHKILRDAYANHIV